MNIIKQYLLKVIEKKVPKNNKVIFNLQVNNDYFPINYSR